jgi:hypothetical protein
VFVGTIREIGPAPGDQALPEGGPWWVASVDEVKGLKGPNPWSAEPVLVHARTSEGAPLLTGQQVLLLLRQSGKFWIAPGAADVRPPEAAAALEK